MTFYGAGVKARVIHDFLGSACLIHRLCWIEFGAVIFYGAEVEAGVRYPWLSRLGIPHSQTWLKLNIPTAICMKRPLSDLPKVPFGAFKVRAFLNLLQTEADTRDVGWALSSPDSLIKFRNRYAVMLVKFKIRPFRNMWTKYSFFLNKMSVS